MRLRDALTRISGEHRLPACSSRQLAEMLVRLAFRFREKLLPAGCRPLQASSLRSPECCEHACNYSPALRCSTARAYSRFNFAMKVALISAGQTASHS